MVEDTHGVSFHRFLIDEVWRRGLVQGPLPRVRRLPAKKCNPKIYRKSIAPLVNVDSWRILVVIDSEGRAPQHAAERDFLGHVKKYHDRFRVATVVPRHEAWLCIGLGGRPSPCRSRPEAVLERLLGERFDKTWLAAYADRVNLDLLLGESDFREYLRGLAWLVEGP